MAGPLAFPNAPRWVWQASFSVAAIVALAGVLVLVYDFFIRPRGRRLDPFIATAIVAVIVALVSLGIYVAKAPQHALEGHLNAPAALGDPEISLLPPTERHEIRWSPTNSNEIRIASEGKISEGNWSVPVFALKTTTAISAQDVSVAWQIDMVGIESIVKTSPLLEESNFKFEVNKVTINGISKNPSWLYNLSQSETTNFPFVTPSGTKAFIPLPVFANLMLYTIALMPNEVGAKISPFKFTATVSWNLPRPGLQKFSVTAHVFNAKGPNLSSPRVDALMSFTVEKL
ncbi:hypothetical protein [Rhodopseudomonas sp. BR0G17]|uniref:hypothetical protein n=1 Tax=Rhodopseudomonas sp. BR0G17 TaxID=2269368 RepID=UPI0013E019DA|nr:hypothetical protein [Rhodopseudomonas sp. BR0G17]